MAKPRIKGLDSLRGMAAATVVIAHVCDNLIKGHSFDEYTPLYLFRAAHESVIFFFLLSGYVLTYQIQTQNYFNYKQFIKQRFFRIYIPYLIVIIFTFVLFIVFHHGDYINNNDKSLVWARRLDFDSIKNHLILIGNFNTNEYNPVIWSLVHEMRISLIFPILLFVISFKWKNAFLVAVILSFLAALAVTFNVNPAKGYNNSYLYTIHYFSFFVLGGLIVKHSTALSTWYLRLKRKTRFTVILISLLIFNYSRMVYLIPHKLEFYKISLFNEFIADWLTAISAGIFIIYAIQIVNNRNWLLHKFPLFLGKISYSLYLIHIPIILVCYSIFFSANKLLVMAISIPTGIILSIIINKYIERPSAALGKKFGDIKNRKSVKMKKEPIIFY